jgi:MoaA/NifB/PqqE/SkfB family radical SAM enzyme
MLFSKPKYKCKAAEYSLLFQPSGEILACHYNRGNILGIYPTNSISEVWNGKKRKELVKSIRKAKFNKGCFVCKEALKMGLEHSAGINKYDYIVPYKSKMPLSMEFQLDNICNLECVMCSGEYSSGIRKNREKGNPYISPYDEEFVKQLDEYIPHLKQASFTGGEPFLFDIYYKIWDRIKLLNPDLQIYVSTNGTILNEKVKDYLNKLNFNFAISIDSVNKENYEHIRKNAILEKTLENIDYFIDYCTVNKRTINIKCLVTPMNYMDIPRLIEYFNDCQINVIPKTVILPGFASMESLELAELQKAIYTFDNLQIKTDSLIQKRNLERFEEIKNQLISTLKKVEIKTGNPETKEEIERMKEKLFLHIFTTSRSENVVSESEKNKFDSLFTTELSNRELFDGINYFLNIPSETLRNEFKRKDFEKLKARFERTKI